MNKKESICFNCKRALDSKEFHCPWSEKFEPVEGWVTVPGRTYVMNDKKTQGVQVVECPLFIKDKKYFDMKDIIQLIVNKYGVTENAFYKRRMSLITRYEKDTGEILPQWCKLETEEEM